MAVATNPQVLARFIQAGRVQRVGLLLIAHSWTTYNGFGLDHGIQDALLKLGLKMYATHLCSCGEGGSGDGTGISTGSGCGYRGTSPAADSGYAAYRSSSALSSALKGANQNSHRSTLSNGSDRNRPASALWNYWNMDGIANYAPCDALYLHSTNLAHMPAFDGGLGVGIGSPLYTDQALTYHLWTPKGPSMTGNLAVSRYDNGSIVHGGAGYDTITGTAGANSMVRNDVNYPAGGRAGAIEMRWNPFQTSLGPFMATFQQFSNPATLTGFTLSTFYGLGGQSAYDMALAIRAMPDQSIDHILTAKTELQNVGWASRKLLIPIMDDLNFRNENTKLGDAPDGLADSRVVYGHAIRAILTRIRDRWLALGGAFDNLSFWLIGSQLVDTTSPDDTELVGYRAELEAIAAENRTTVAVTQLSEILSISDLLNAGTNVGDLQANSNIVYQPAPVVFQHAAFTSCNWTNATRVITGSGFTAYSGPHFVRVTGGTGVTRGRYRATGATSSAITLEVGADINGASGDIADNSVTIVQYDPIHLHALSYGNAMLMALSRAVDAAFQAVLPTPRIRR